MSHAKRCTTQSSSHRCLVRIGSLSDSTASASRTAPREKQELLKHKPAYFLLCSLMLGTPVSLGKGLSKAARKQIEDHYRESRDKKGGTFLVVIKDGIPAGLDGVLFVSGEFGSGGAPKIKKNMVEAEIEKGSIRKLKPKDTQSYYSPGSLLIIERLRIKNDHIELQTRTDEPTATREHLPGNPRLYERAKLKFYFDRSTMDSDQLEVVFSAVEAWLKAFHDRTEALKHSMGLSGPRIRFGMTTAEVETLMGAPRATERHGETVIYHWEKLTVEFIQGRATRYATR